VTRRLRLDVNGVARDVDVEDGEPLLYVLRNQLGLNGPRFGCGLAQCGSCAVLVDGVNMRACVLPAAAAANKSVVTLEGLGDATNPSPVQQAFIDEQAMQCGYCSNGMIVAATALLEKNPSPSRADVIDALDGTLCRCGSHNRIVRAVLRAADVSKPDDA
jgi:nicotinate dehydrogenase subunit A